MKTLFDSEFCTDDYDQEMLDYIRDKWGVKARCFKLGLKCLTYGVGNNYFWTETLLHTPPLTKQKFKEKIGMITKHNKMPKLEAGKHVVKYDGDLYLVLENNRGMFAKRLFHDTGHISVFDGEIEEVHTLPAYFHETFRESNYNKDTLIWKKQEDKVELTLPEVAAKLGIPVEQLRIKD